MASARHRRKVHASLGHRSVISDLATAVEDQWSDLMGERPEIIDCVPAGWDTVQSFSTKCGLGDSQSKKVLRAFVKKDKAERKLVRLENARNSFHIYRRLRK